MLGFFLWWAACGLPEADEVVFEVPPASADRWEPVLQAPAAGDWTWSQHVAGTWRLPLSGLLDLTDPVAVAAGKRDVQWEIVVLVHVLEHPVHGLYLVDTGIDRDLAAGGTGPLRGFFRYYARELEGTTATVDLLGERAPLLDGVFLTHTHYDHILGLPDLPPEVPVFVGPGEAEGSGLVKSLMRSTHAAAWGDRTATVLSGGQPMPPLERAVDVFGDGSFWALATPGHTPGSMSYLVRTTGGPVLFVGDTSHTRWGWDHGVPPGTYTEDIPRNKQSLAQLRELVQAYPAVDVVVGHELGPVPGEAQRTR